MSSGLPSQIDLNKNPCRLYENVEYKDYWAGVQKCKLDEIEHTIVRDLLPTSGHRIIDIGCGYGRLSDCYIDRFQQVVMLDGSMSLLRQAREKIGGSAKYIAGDIKHLPFRRGSFDGILMVRLCHHLTDLQMCLSEVLRILCQNGRLVFNYRNKRDLLHVVKWFMGMNPYHPLKMEPVEIYPMLIGHHPKVIHRILRDAGLSGIEYRGAGVLDKVAAKIGPLGKWIPSIVSTIPFLGMIKVSPWIFCAGNSTGSIALANAESLDDLLQCPSCGGGLLRESQRYICLLCNIHYPIEDGIIDLRVE